MHSISGKLRNESDPQSDVGGGEGNGNYKYRVLALYTLAAVLALADKMSLKMFQENIRLEFGLSDMQLGALTGFAFAVMFAIAGLPLAYLAERIGRRTVIFASLMAWSAMTALSAGAASFAQLFAFRVGVGIGEAGLGPSAQATISGLFRPAARGRALSVYFSSLWIGALVGTMAGGWLNEIYGWRIAMIVLGIPGIALAAVIRVSVREEPTAPPRVSAVSPLSEGWSAKLRSISRLKSLRYLIAGSACQIMVVEGDTAFFPVYLARNHAMSSGSIGTWLGLSVVIFGLGGALSSGSLVDRLRRRDQRWALWILAGSLLLGMVAWGVSLSVPNIVAVVLFYSLGLSLMAMADPPRLVVAHSLVPDNMRATVSALLYTIMSLIGGAIGPLVIGLLSDLFRLRFGMRSLPYAMMSVLLLAGAAAIGCYMLSSRYYRRELDAYEETLQRM
jgi:MFS family permease